jgi:dihydrofolate reductase
MPKKITLIAAAGQNNELGKNNDLLWHLPDDFKRFKTLTTGHYIIMGRKTFESFPKPLPNRTHIIITRNENYNVPEGCMIVTSLSQAISICPEDQTVYIIGGGEIYQQSIAFADCIELTRVHGNFDADVFFPIVANNEWRLTQSEYHEKDAKHAFAFTFETYLKIQ